MKDVGTLVQPGLLSGDNEGKRIITSCIVCNLQLVNSSFITSTSEKSMILLHLLPIR